MANGRNQGRSKGDAGRDAGGFVAIPWSVLDSAAYRGLSHPAKALLIEIARQFVRDNNGRLLASAAYLSARGWNSADVITRAKRELIDAGLIHETVKGHRPNKASWYAVTWRTLDRHSGYDPGAAATFERGAYKTAVPLTIQPTREENFAKWRRPSTPSENAMLRPSPGAEKARIAPSGGAGAGAAAPSPGAMAGCFGGLPTPSGGNHLERPSAVQRVRDDKAGQDAAPTDAQRVRDRDLDPALFDPETGEHVPIPARQARQVKESAQAWVTAARAR